MPIPKSHQAAAQSLITVDRVEARGYDQPVSVSLRFRCLKNYHSNQNEIFMHEDPGLFMTVHVKILSSGPHGVICISCDLLHACPVPEEIGLRSSTEMETCLCSC